MYRTMSRVLVRVVDSKMVRSKSEVVILLLVMANIWSSMIIRTEDNSMVGREVILGRGSRML